MLSNYRYKKKRIKHEKKLVYYLLYYYLLEYLDEWLTLKDKNSS